MNAFYPQISGQAFEKNRGGKKYTGAERELTVIVEENCAMCVNNYETGIEFEILV